MLRNNLLVATIAMCFLSVSCNSSSERVPGSVDLEQLPGVSEIQTEEKIEEQKEENKEDQKEDQKEDSSSKEPTSETDQDDKEPTKPIIIENDPLDLDTFSFPAPKLEELTEKHSLWATYYYLPEVKYNSGDIPLRDMEGNELGPIFSLRDWCYTAMEGSVRVLYDNGDAKTFNYDGVTDDHRVDCTSIFPRHPAIGRTKYREAKGVYGDGVEQYILSPYRTVATDIEFIKPGTAIYIPEARGAKIVTNSGRTIIHDGYFFAGDKGGAIKGVHIDVYIGTSLKASFFPWVQSKETGLFDAYIVTDEKIINDLLELHTVK